VTAITARLPIFTLNFPSSEGSMSSAVLERIVEQPRKLDLVAVPPEPRAQEKELADPYPLLPVVIAGAISLTLAVMFVGSILAWLALRHTGVMAP
jgi:hypothetical protein